MYSTEVPQQIRIWRDADTRCGTVTCGYGRGWTCCLLFASRGSGVRVPLAPLPDSRYLARSDAVNSGSPRIPSRGRRCASRRLGGIWEIVFSLSPGDGWCRGISPGAILLTGGLVVARSGASSPSSNGTGERGAMAARSRSESSHRAWSACLRSSRIRSEAWA
jgi:hypothetical protein